MPAGQHCGKARDHGQTNVEVGHRVPKCNPPQEVQRVVVLVQWWVEDLHRTTEDGHSEGGQEAGEAAGHLQATSI